MNEIVNKCLLAGDKFMLEKHLRQPGFTWSACGPFIKKKKESRNLKKQEIHDQNKLDKVCFQNDMAYGNFKDLTRRIASDKILCDKAFNIAKSAKNDGYQRGLASMVYKFFYETSGSAIKIETCN